jgi:hypothetical protein
MCFRCLALRCRNVPATFTDTGRSLCIMWKVSTICLTAAALIGGMVLAYPAAGFEPTSGLLTDHEKMLKYKDQGAAQPYAMNYVDEAADTIGVRGGRWEVIGTGFSRSGFMPNVSSGIDRGHPMLKLQWRVGR